MKGEDSVLFADHEHAVSLFVGIYVETICLKDARHIVSSRIVVLPYKVAKIVLRGAHESCD